MSVRLWPAGQLAPWRRGFPFFAARPRSAVERLRAWGSGQVWRQGPLWKRLALAGVMTIGWPFVTFLDSLRLRTRERAEGRDRIRFGELYGAALARNIPPNQYAGYRSRANVSAADLSDYLMPLDLRALGCFDLARGAASNDVQDKAVFERICRERRLPCVPTLASFDRGVSTGEEVLRAWTEALFVKALTGNKGAGAELWRPGGRGFISTAGEDLSVEELIAALRQQNCIVQPVLEDCAALGTLGTTALSSVRIVTAKGRTSRSSVITASASLPVGTESLTGHSGIQCGIDVRDGTIVRAFSPNEDDAHVEDRNLIDFQLPYWTASVELVCRAHDEAFSAFTTLGWDVALTSAGPILLETNVGWGMVAHQKLTGPLGRTSLSEVIDELLAPAHAGRSAAGHPVRPASRSPSPVPPASRDPSVAAGRKRRRRAAKDC